MPGSHRVAPKQILRVVETHSVRRAGLLADFLNGVERALRLVRLAEGAYRAGSRRAGVLHASAEVAHYQLLKSICRLTEQQAEVVEPAFTSFEQRLFRLPHLGGW
jgi:hypothetical protein